MNRGLHRDGSSKLKEQEELLIFGYSCKLFRDDQKALYIDEEKHLIPWMGNDQLQLDRFDVRGALYDLSVAESKGSPITDMTPAELKEEEICEEERYLDMYGDQTKIQEEQEEEMKRLHIELSAQGSAYRQVQFEYDASSNGHMSQIEAPAAPVVPYEPAAADEALFIAPTELTIPEGMDVPHTVKHNNIVLRTAKFVAAQGAQMEIVLKTKQAGNAFFNFLSFDNHLNPYYKHLIMLLKTGKYRESNGQEGEESDINYSLYAQLPQVMPNLTPGTNTPSKPSPHCSYTKLISKIKEKQKASGLEEAELYSPSMPSSPVQVDAQHTVGKVERKHSTALVAGSATSSRGGLVDYQLQETAEDGSDMEDSSPSPVNPPARSSNQIDYNKIKWPSRSLQMVIDKMACYIVKNGPAFEDLVKSRNDSRFHFLKKTDEYHPYFLCKVQLYSEVHGDLSKSSKDLRKFGLGNFSKTSSGGRSIKFSIKSKETEAAVTSHTTFPVESSTSEEEEDMDDEEREKRRLQREERRSARKEREENERKERELALKKEKLKRDDSSGNEDLYDIFKYAQEMEKEEKAEAVTRPAGQHKQLERKKKAAAFLSKLKTGSENTQPKTAVFGPQLPQDMDICSPMSSTNSLRCTSSEPPITVDIRDVHSSSSSGSQVQEDEPLPQGGKDEPKSQLNNGNSRTIAQGSSHRSRHRTVRARSESRSPDRKRSRKIHSSHRKRPRSRSRTPSRDKSRSSYKSHHKRSRHADKKRRKHRKRRSPSISSLSSLSSRSTATTLPSSDSDGDVQVINAPEDSKTTSRSSSVMSVPGGKKRSAGNASSNGSDEAAKSGPALSLLTPDENTSSSVDTNEGGRKPAVNPRTSKAMAKITEGLRAKLHAMLEKKS